MQKQFESIDKSTHDNFQLHLTPKELLEEHCQIECLIH